MQTRHVPRARGCLACPGVPPILPWLPAWGQLQRPCRNNSDSAVEARFCPELPHCCPKQPVLLYSRRRNERELDITVGRDFRVVRDEIISEMQEGITEAERMCTIKVLKKLLNNIKSEELVAIKTK